MNIYVSGSGMNPSRVDVGARGSYGTEPLSFQFSPEWNGLSKKLVFYPQRGTPVYCAVFNGDAVIVPYSVMKCAGDNTFIISGYTVEDGHIGVKRITATGIAYVSPAPDDTLNEPEPPDPTELETLIAKLGAPYIADNGDWYIWSAETEDFVDSGTPARGPKGETGKGLVLLGVYSSVEALEEAVTDPDVGDAYSVGTDDESMLVYIWDGEDWQDHGSIRGVGIESIVQTEYGEGALDDNVWTVTLTNGTMSTFTVKNGPQGPQGPAGNVYYGSEEPPGDSNAVIWINPAGAPSPVTAVMTARDEAVAAAESAAADASSASADASSASGYAESAQEDADSAKEYALKSEAWAVGTRNGLPVTSPDPAYNNSSEYWAIAAGNSATAAASNANRMAFVAFTTNANGHVVIVNADRAANTAFELKPDGHMQVTLTEYGG